MEGFQGLSVQLSVDCGVIDICENKWQNDGSFIINLCKIILLYSSFLNINKT